LLGSPDHFFTYAEQPDTSDITEKVQILSIVVVATTDRICVCEELG
jgi:hypothetical protein